MELVDENVSDQKNDLNMNKINLRKSVDGVEKEDNCLLQSTSPQQPKAMSIP